MQRRNGSALNTVNEIPDIAIQRLPLYLRALSQLSERGQRITSSQELARHLQISSAQIRKDLSYFGEFGKQGTGYEIPYLIEQLKVKDAMSARLRYPWDGTTVEIRITGKPKGGASVVADNINLGDAAVVERRRALWKTVLDGLRQHLSR